MARKKDFPGFYILTHKPTGVFYVGSTSILNKRMRVHKSRLNTGKHKNKRLMDVYTTWDDFKIDLTITDTIEEAKVWEKELLDKYIGTELCCNLHDDPDVPFSGVRGRPRSEQARRNMAEASKLRRHSEEVKRKISEANKGNTHSAATKLTMSLAKSRKVSIDGVIYDSALQASIVLGIPNRTLRNRLQSKSPKYTDYFFI